MHGHTKAIEVMVAAGASLEARSVGITRQGDRYAATPLHLAAAKGDVGTIRALIAAGAYVEATDNGLTPLHFAASMGHASAIEALTAAGASLSARDGKNGYTPLHQATVWSHVDAIRALVDAGAALEAKSDTGWTPRQIATFMTGNVEAIRVLTAGGSGKGGGKEKRVREEGLPEAASTRARAL